MLFIWTNDGGPFQYIGLVLFLLQAIVPQLLVWFYQDVDEVHQHHSRGPSVHQSNQNRPIHRQLHRQATATTTTTTSFVHHHQQQQILFIPWELILTTLFVMILMYRSVHLPLNHTNNIHENNVPVAEEPGDNQRRETEGGGEHPYQQPAQTRRPTTMEQRVTRSIANFFGLEENPRLAGWIRVMLFLLPILLLLLLMYGHYRLFQESTLSERPSQRNNRALVDDYSYWIPVLQWMPFIQTFLAVIGFSAYLYRGGRPNIGPGVGAHPRRRTVTRQQQEAKMNKMIELVHQVPMEMFVAQEEGSNGDVTLDNQQADGGSYSSLSISHLKQMLQRRGIPKKEIDSFVERKNLVDRLKQCRKYADSCCICFETYQVGDTLRILPHCHHELHVDCLDNWVYTFANQPVKISQDPSCPLCKETLTTTSP
jgi:hypothetical protein